MLPPYHEPFAGGAMQTIPIRDGLSASIDAQLAPWSSLAKYAQELPRLLAAGADFSRLQALTLADPAATSLDLGLTLEKPVALGNGAPDLTINADAGVHFAVI